MADTKAAIVALPAPLDPIRLVGDEEKHATLLFFGETSSLPADAKQTLTDSAAQAASVVSFFSEIVRDVQRLGSDNPPALVAMLSDRNLSQIRNLFMMNPKVKDYLSNNAQHPNFIPHVTLGFPDFTEEVVLRSLMGSIFRIQFDRLAVWWNDERIEYPLSSFGDSVAEMSQFLTDNMLKHDSMSAVVESTINDAKHHGVKGQKWGVRRPRDPSTGLVKRSLKDKLTGTKAMDLTAARESNLKPRQSSADQIVQDRIASKLATGGTKSLSNRDIQDFTRRLQLQDDLERSLAKMSAQDKAKADGFIKSFVKKQTSRQFDRVANKAIDVAIEAALKQAGVKVSDTNPALGKGITEVASRLKPKKK